GHRQHDPGQHTREGGRQHHAPHHLAARTPHAHGGFLHARWHHFHGFLGGQHDGGQQEQGQPDPTSRSGLRPGQQHHGGIGKDPSQDRRQARQGLGAKAHGRGYFALWIEFGQEHCGENAKGYAQQRRNPHHHQSPDNGIPKAATFLEGRGWEFRK